MVEITAIEADPCLHSYIIKGVTEGRSYTYLKPFLGYHVENTCITTDIENSFGYLVILESEFLNDGR